MSGYVGALHFHSLLEADSHARVAPLVEKVVLARVGAVVAADTRDAPAALAAVARARVHEVLVHSQGLPAHDLFHGLNAARSRVGHALGDHEVRLLRGAGGRNALGRRNHLSAILGRGRGERAQAQGQDGEEADGAGH
ncbi:hypothetical protein CMO84_04005 [Candidatus Woesearchaeota archaeon]|nr:hypothetical protein [Candidatus Woesearchaeota archaeon]